MFTDFKDSSTNDLAITANGDAQLVKSTKKYGNAAGYFDGSSYLQIEIPDWNPGVNNEPFTIEFWAYFLDVNTLNVLISKHGGFPLWNGTNGLNFNFYNYGPTDLYFEFWNGSNSQAVSNTVSLQNNQWTHFAIVYDGSVTSVFVDGTKLSNTSSGSYGSLPAATKFEIGSQGNGAEYIFNGYIDDLRITKGIARYTANFTPPTQQLPDPTDPHGANVSLLLHMDGTNGSQSFIDSSLNNFTVTAGGDTQTSTAEKKFGSAAGYFDGNGDYLQGSNDSALSFDTGDFTVEAWVYLLAYNTYSQIAGRHTYGSDLNWLFSYNSTGKLEFYYGGGTLGAVSTGTVPLNTWTHVALTRSSGLVKFFINGSDAGGSATVNASIASTIPFTIGADNTGAANTFLNGYIDELRITKGVARYTANFIPQTAPFANPTV